MSQVPALTTPPLNALSALSALRAAYNPAAAYFRGMVIGDKGAGKTTLALTCRRPVMHICFDPDGSSVLMDTHIDPATNRPVSVCPPWLYPLTHYQTLDAEAFDRLDGDLRVWNKENIWPRIGTVVFDSLTTFGDAVVAKVLAETAREKSAAGRRTDKLELQDYGVIADKTQRIIKTLLNLPTNVLILGHIQEDTDEITHRTIYNVLYPGQKTSQKLPIYTSEIYYMQLQDGGMDPKTRKPLPATRTLLTTADGKFKASTRLGRAGRFSLQEAPDIKALMTKAGLVTTDLPFDLSAPEEQS